MAKIAVKGTVLEVEIATVLTAVAQLTAIQEPSVTPSVFDTTTIDQAGPGERCQPTGYTKAEGFSARGFLDEELAPHAFLRDASDDGDMLSLNIVKPNGAECAFDAVCAYKPSGDMRGGGVFEISSVGIDGSITRTDP